ncbi:MAG: hypothetical protein JXA82_18085 [Sedimentisphaerales bacterium]|nr:hypothetical protein [Sedimentisphaerales bacterium]
MVAYVMAWTYFPVLSNTLIKRAPLAELRENVVDLFTGFGYTAPYIPSAPATASLLYPYIDSMRYILQNLCNETYGTGPGIGILSGTTFTRLEDLGGFAYVMNQANGQSDWTSLGLIRAVHVNEIKNVIQWMAEHCWIIRKSFGEPGGLGAGAGFETVLVSSISPAWTEYSWDSARGSGAGTASDQWANAGGGNWVYNHDGGVMLCGVGLVITRYCDESPQEWRPYGYPTTAVVCDNSGSSVSTSSWPTHQKHANTQYYFVFVPSYWAGTSGHRGMLNLPFQINGANVGIPGGDNPTMRTVGLSVSNTDFDFEESSQTLGWNEQPSFFVPPDDLGDITLSWQIGTAYTLYNCRMHNSKYYQCIQGHTSSSSDEPGVGANWETYWQEVGDYGWENAPYVEGYDTTTAYWWGTPSIFALYLKPYFSWA